MTDTIKFLINKIVNRQVALVTKDFNHYLIDNY